MQRIIARLVGAKLALRLCEEGILLDPAEAHRKGLIDALVDPDGVICTAIEWCEDILSLPQKTMLAERMEARKELRVLYEADIWGQSKNTHE